MSFNNQIQQWINYDNQLKQLNDKVKELREKKKELEDHITEHVSNNNLSNTTIQMGNDKLKFVNVKETEQLTFKYLEKCLGEVIKNENQVKIIMEYIKQKRTSKIVSEIKRFNNN